MQDNTVTAKPFPWRLIRNIAIQLTGAAVIGISVNKIVTQSKAPVALKGDELIVSEMRGCISTYGSTARNDIEINRIHRQCWNSAELKGKHKEK